MLELGKTYRTIGGEQVLMKTSDASGTYLFDVRGRRWNATWGMGYDENNVERRYLQIVLPQPESIERPVPAQWRPGEPLLEIVQAILNGLPVQVRASYTDNSEWMDVRPGATQLEKIEFVIKNPVSRYRVKPTPIVAWGIVTREGKIEGFANEQSAYEATNHYDGSKVLRIELDPETGHIIDSRTEKP